MYYRLFNQSRQKSSFHFPLKNTKLNNQWVRFVNRVDWAPTKNSVFCELHFEEKYLSKGKRTILRWSSEHVPTIYSKEFESCPSELPTYSTYRKSPKKRAFQNDQLDEFQSKDIINSINDLTEFNSTPEFKFQQFGDSVVFLQIKI